MSFGKCSGKIIYKTIEKLLTNTGRGYIIRVEIKERRKPKESKMTKQEQVKEILEVIKHCGDYTNRDCAECDYRLYGECKNQKQCEAEALYNEGYRKVPFGATVLAPEERNDEIREMHEILEGRDELIAKVGILGRENYDLKAENKQLKTECALLDDELRIARQETIDVLNKVKEKLNNTPNGWAYTTYIDELIKGV